MENRLSALPTHQMRMVPPRQREIEWPVANMDTNAEYGNKEYTAHLEKLKTKFDEFKKQIDQLKPTPEEFKNHQLPLARIKKIMKSDDDVKMISAEAPILFAKACELFITDLTYRALFNTNLHKRKTLQKSDIEAIVNQTEMFDFLIDIVPRDGTERHFQQKPDYEKGMLAASQRVQPPPKPMLMEKSSGLMRNPFADSTPGLKNPTLSSLTAPKNKLYLQQTDLSVMQDYDGEDQYSMISKLHK